MRAHVDRIIASAGRLTLLTPQEQRHQRRAAATRRAYVVASDVWAREAAAIVACAVPQELVRPIIVRAERILRTRAAAELHEAALVRAHRLAFDEPYRTLAGLYVARLCAIFARCEQQWADDHGEGTPAFATCCELAFAALAAPGASDVLLFDDFDAIAFAKRISERLTR
jgi:hypothetical protein